MPCPICDDTRWKTVTTDGVDTVVRCDCWSDELSSWLLKEARIPPRFARAELETFDADTDSQRDALRKARQFVERFPAVDKGFLFHGTSGVGKTHLAVAILKAVLRRTVKSRSNGFFFETRELLRIVRDTYNRSVEETEMEVLKPLLGADLLVLDDLGAERTSDWVQETLGLVVNVRYNERKPTIFTSNLADLPNETDPRSFVYQLGRRTRSRLMEMCEWIHIEGADMREVGPAASAEAIGQWQRTSPGSPEVSRRTTLPEKTRGRARATLREGGPVDLRWSGGKAGSSK